MTKKTDKRLKYVELANIVDKMSVTEFMFLYNIFYSANNRERLYEYKLYEYKPNNSMTSDTFEDILNMSVSSYCSVGTKLKRLVLRRYNELNEMYTRKELFDIIKNEGEVNINEAIENDEEFDIETSCPFESISKQPVKTILQNPYNFSVLPFNDNLEKLANDFDKLLLERKNLKDSKGKLDQKLEEKGKEILDFIEKNNECSETLTDYFVLDNNLSQVWKIKKIKSNSQAEYICDTIDNILNKETGTEIGTKIVDKLIEKRKKNNLKQIGIEN